MQEIKGRDNKMYKGHLKQKYLLKALKMFWICVLGIFVLLRLVIYTSKSTSKLVTDEICIPQHLGTEKAAV